MVLMFRRPRFPFETKIFVITALKLKYPNQYFTLLQITIDISPPQAGDVHDGLPGSPEVDFQQEFYLNFYWNGFFDSESGVKYYKYVVSDHCWTKEDLFASIEVQILLDNHTSSFNFDGHISFTFCK